MTAAIPSTLRTDRPGDDDCGPLEYPSRDWEREKTDRGILPGFDPTPPWEDDPTPPWEEDEPEGEP
jgi:hypothetical protein